MPSKKRKSKASAIPPRNAQDKRRGRPVTPSPLDPEYCHSSDSEPEDYGDLHGQERWEIDGVVDSHCGENDRMSYKIRWNKKGWQRADGTSEEWIPEPVNNRSTHANLVKKYEAKEFSELDSLEARPFGIEFQVGRFYSHMNSMAPGCSKNIWNQTGYRDVLGMGNAQVSGFHPTDPDFIPEDCEDASDSDSSAGDRRPPRRNRPAVPKRERAGSASLGGTPDPSSQPVRLTALQELEQKWNRAASAVGAASITLTNNIDKTIPPLKQTFEYSEMDLRWQVSLSQELRSEGYPPGPESFIRCNCYECDYPHRCGCQGPAFKPGQPRALHSFAYDRNGYFDLDFEGVSVECNVSCRCPATCRNRVVQRPRSIPIEIVKFEIRGWGVRAQQAIKAGQVLGSFTGEIITKEAASRIVPRITTAGMHTGQNTRFTDRNKYLFDLDSQHESHHCEPNLKIFSVCYDTVPDTGLERLAVVALRNIPAGEELVFDYGPTNKAGQGDTQCSCGSQVCRGYF